MINRTIGKQHGAILILVAITLAVLLGFAGLVIDLGGMFVAKTELQSALDSCALAAAQELDGATDSTLRATSAGLTAGDFNKVKYQQSPAGIVGAEVQFSDSLAGSYSVGVSGNTSAKYARCTHTTGGIAAYLIQLVGGSSVNSVGALAKATTTPAQSVCALPLGLLPKTGGNSSNNYGYQIGEWVTMLYGASPSPGEMGLFNLDGSTNTPETINELINGYCNSKIGDSVGTNGTKAAIFDAWNARFGIYKNNSDITAYGKQPDFSGYAYTSDNWPNAVPQNAYDGSPASDPTGTAANFEDKRLAFASYDDTGTSVAHGDTIYYSPPAGLKGGYTTLAAPGSTAGGHKQYGGNRRIIGIPVLNQSGSNYTIIDYACVLMLVPLTCNSSGNNCDPVQLEYRGLASSFTSPCTANGYSGGSLGPLVPVLVE